ncbi:hypothetical protein IH879_20365, partial [candidate division KSB1 bacterium]|nr:hypothetical protein [candidate division KSB1 bacterium]
MRTKLLPLFFTLVFFNFLLSQENDLYRLSHKVEPIYQFIHLNLDPDKDVYSGTTKIELEIAAPLSSFRLHGKNFEIAKMSLIQNYKRITCNFEFQEFGLLKITPREALTPGKYKIEFEFNGSFSKKGEGIVKFTKDSLNYIYTQMQDIYARQFFPCFDEPGKKAEFLVSMFVNKNLETISNMPITSEEIKGNKKLVKFERTPLMSTYLLYMGVGEFEYLESDYENRTKIRIVTTPGKKSQGKFALDITKKVLKYFEDYTGINYPLPKLDMIAIPDFAVGAMENWGAITFREILLLSTKNTSFRVKRDIAMVVAHELWHQWSGNLVTMKWWNDLWLNESFANYMGYKALDHYFPEWNIWEYHLESETLGALSIDSLKTTHPISVDVKSANEIEELFDEISYGKGGSVLRMIDSFLGEETFRKGVSFYLNKFKYSNAEADDFWICLSKFSKEDIRKIAKSWINQPGYPLLKVESRGENLVIEQEAFQDAFRGQRWLIPLTIRSGGKVKTVVIKKRRQKIKIKSKNFKLNYNQTGFLRVK